MTEHQDENRRDDVRPALLEKLCCELVYHKRKRHRCQTNGEQPCVGKGVAQQRGQLDYALNAMKPFDLNIDVAGIAKAKSDMSLSKKPGIRRDVDRIYLPDKKPPVYLEPFMPSTHLLQKIRDEVHRFAITYHRKLRSKRTLESPLEKINGIGKARRLMLLKHFRSIDAIRKASIEEITEVKGINKKVAGDIKKGLR